MTELLRSCSGQWLDLMWKVTWQGGLFILVIFLITKVFRRLSPTIKHLLWMLVIVKFLVMPFVTVPITLPALPTIVYNPITELTAEKPAPRLESEITSDPSGTSPEESIAELREKTPDMPMGSEVKPESLHTLSTEEVSLTRESSRSGVTMPWPSMLFSFWLFGVVILVSGIIVRSLRLARYISMTNPLQDSTALKMVTEGAKQARIKPPPLKVSHKFKSPLACGIFHPTLIFPEHIIEKFSESELRAIINHELAHIKRLDIFTNWFQILVQVFYFFNPLIWYVNRQIRLEREQACDDWVLQTGKENRKTYVDALVKVVELCSKQRGFALGIVGVSEPFTLMARRLKMIMDTGRRISTRLSVSVIIGLVLIGLAGMPACEKKEITYGAKALSANEAAALATRVANEECERLYERRPFSANLYSIELREATWHWGRYDPAGIHGFSAEVSFRVDGSDPKVKVHWSSDNMVPPAREDMLERLMPELEKPGYPAEILVPELDNQK